MRKGVGQSSGGSKGTDVSAPSLCTAETTFAGLDAFKLSLMRNRNPGVKAPSLALCLDWAVWEYLCSARNPVLLTRDLLRKKMTTRGNRARQGKHNRRDMEGGDTEAVFGPCQR
jgi:hypothetical protein